MGEWGIGGFDGYADDIAGLFEELDLTAVTAVGWSMGAQALLRAYPRLKTRIKALLLVGATPRFSAAAHFPWGLHPDEARGMGLKVRRNLDRALEGFRKRMFAEGELDEPGISERVETVISAVVPPSSTAALDGLETLMEEEVLAEARQVACPTLIVHGGLDRICQPQASRWLESAIPGSVRRCYEGCGHAPFLTRPEVFNADLLRLAGGADGQD
jgi:pimeloyl-[acyl-carrier protein] methyl ester esterase